MIDVCISFRTGGATNTKLPVDRVVLAAFAGRDLNSARKKVEELRQIGHWAPDRVPAFIEVPPELIVHAPEISPGNHRTSGEVEYVLLNSKDGWLVSVGSDHSDREVEVNNLPASKVVCPKVVASTFWRLEDVEGHWDEMILQAYVTFGDGERRHCQREKLSALLPPRDLLKYVEEGGWNMGDGFLVFSGSIPFIVSAEGATSFGFSLEDPILHRSISHEYLIRPTVSGYMR